MNDDYIKVVTDSEIEILIDKIHTKYGYDFSGYSFASFERRLNKITSKFNITSFDKLLNRILTDDVFFNTFVEEVTVNVTEMFRDPGFFKLLRKEIIPELATHPIIRIWHAGCSTGEEVYSMAILLKEAGMLERSLLYATDINKRVLDSAKTGIFPLEIMKLSTENYHNAGMLYDFSNYYTAKYEMAMFNEEFKRRMVFSVHNLAIDRSFNEFNLILCRNVLIYFNNTLQNRVLNLFSDSLVPRGFLALGNKESINFSSIATDFETVNRQQRMWRKIK